MTPSTRFFRNTTNGLTADLVLLPVDCLDLQQVSYHHQWAGTAVASIVYEMSNDPLVATDPDNADWLPFDPDPVYGNVIVGATAGQLVVIRQLPRWLRCRFVWASGSSTIATWTHGRNI